MAIEINFDKQLGTEVSTLSVNHFYKIWNMEPSELVLQPEFQRNFVWNDYQKAFLMDSILRGVPVPEVYIQRTNDADGNERTIVVDGQQRLTSCLTFIDGEFKIPNNQDFGALWRGQYFADLPEDLRQRFRAFKFVVRELPQEVNEDVLKELFRRLNSTVVSLNAQELRNAAFSNEFTNLVTLIAGSTILRDIGVFSANDYKRQRSDEFIAEVFDVYQTRAFPNKKEGLEGLYETFENTDSAKIRGFLDQASHDFGRVLRVLAPIKEDLKKTRFRNKSDLYSLLVYLVLNVDKLVVEDEFSKTMLVALTAFGERVNKIKKATSAEEGITSFEEFGGESSYVNAAKYLAAVEKAASDRLNRIRRDECIEFELGYSKNPVNAYHDDKDDIRNWAQSEVSVEDIASIDD